MISLRRFHSGERVAINPDLIERESHARSSLVPTVD